MRKTRMPNLFAQGALLALEAQQVIALRLAKLATGGPAAKREARHMVAEKMHAGVSAAALAGTAAVRGTPAAGAHQVVRMLRRRVRANRKRLGQG